MKFLIVPLTAAALFFSANSFAQNTAVPNDMLELCRTTADLTEYLAIQRDAGVSKQAAVKALTDVSPNAAMIFNNIADIVYKESASTLPPKQLSEIAYETCIQPR